MLGQDHFFVTDSRSSVAGLQLSTGSIDVNWQAAACTTSPCPEISLAGVAPGDKVIVNQTGNSDGSSTLFSLTPGTGTCAPSTFCVTSAPPVPNATLVAFDFTSAYLPWVYDTLVFTSDSYFCLCLLVPANSPAPPVTIGGSVTPPDTTAAPDPELLPPWPEEAVEGSRESAKIEVANFIPVDAHDLGISPGRAQDEIQKGLAKWVALQRFFLGSSATVQSFLGKLAQSKPLAAVGFIGHSLDDANGQGQIYSVGLRFADKALVAEPNDDPQFPVRQYQNSLAVAKINTKAKVVFIGSCFIAPPFKALWNIQDQTVGQALIVPQGQTIVLLGHAVVAWAHLLDDLILGHMSAGAAVTDTNLYLRTLSITEQWQVVGDANVKIDQR